MPKPLHIFQAGRRTASDGQVIEFTEAMLAACAKAYDPAKHEAPLVVGHPATNGPAYGWVKGLAVDGAALNAEPANVEPQFAELVNTRRFGKVSASFYPPTHAANPVPGVWYLRHVGFLGAEPPAVKGLRAPEFSDDATGLVEFSDWGNSTIAGLLRRFRDWLISDKGLEVADRVFPDYLVAAIEDDARNPNPTPASPVYSETETVNEAELKKQREEQEARDAKLKADKAALDKEVAEFNERQAKAAAEDKRRANAAIAEFVESLVKAGKVLPAHQAGLVAFLAGIESAQVVEFGEGDKKVSQPGATWLRAYLEAQPKIVDFNERAGNNGAVLAGEGGGDTPAQVQAKAQVLADKAIEFVEAERKAGRTVSFTQAVAHVEKQTTAAG